MTRSEDIALILPIDSDRKVRFGDRTYSRYFEEEITRNVRSWRKNGGWLRDIKIYGLLSNGDKIKDNTLHELMDLDVDIAVLDGESVVKHELGFLNEPFCGKYFESICPISEEVTIKTDLDMQLLKPLPKEWFDLVEEGVLIGQYDEESVKGQRQKFNNNLPFDTDLIITHRKHGFYPNYYDMCFSDEILQNPEYKKVREEYGDYYLEEFVVDYLYVTKSKNILPLRYYQYGEGYPSVVDYPRDHIKDICFLHEHIYRDNKFPYDYNPVKERLDYIRLSKIAV